MEYQQLKQDYREFRETLEAEHLKTFAEFGVHELAKHDIGSRILELASGGNRIVDERLNTKAAGVNFENPVMVGAGWDKRGWAVDGLYALGFAGTEVGSVLVHPQYGNDRPRLFTDQSHSVSLNRLGFNSKGQEKVASYLDKQRRPGVVGISLGMNKLTPPKDAPWAHATVADRLHEYADYFVINVASPNTPGLRDLLTSGLGDIIDATQEAVNAKGFKPIFVKTTVDLELVDLNAVLENCVYKNTQGVIDSNTTIDEIIKARYGWQGQMGGVSGNDLQFRAKANDRMRHITMELQGTGLSRIGAGSINDASSAMERIQAGAEVIQIVTAIRERKSKVARSINLGLLELMERDGSRSITDYSGIAA